MTGGKKKKKNHGCITNNTMATKIPGENEYTG